jgi:hypothetical protein
MSTRGCWADRDVVVLWDGEPEQTRLRGWLDGHDGPVPAYRIELVTRLGRYTCPYTATGPDMFEALVRVRRQLEPDSLMVAVQGSRRDTYPSGMARDMGGGMPVYILRPGLRGHLEDLVKTLDDAPLGQIATVDERARAWRTASARPVRDMDSWSNRPSSGILTPGETRSISSGCSLRGQSP